MFHGIDTDGKGYSTRAHLAELIGVLGLPPTDMLKRGIRSHEFFNEDGMYNYKGRNLAFERGLLTILCLGKWKSDLELPQDISLERLEECLEGKNKEMFLVFMRGMLQWRPEDRKTAKELLEDPWLNDQID
jgi:serine/threonine-protein kinase SRPK3